MTTVVVIPCHFLGAAMWDRVRLPLETAGCRLVALDLAGWGERHAELAPDVGLTAHVVDVVRTLETADLRDVTLVGHSYGGVVARGVVARAADRVRHLVLLDAPVARHGDILLDHLPESVAAWYREQARTVGGGWRVPPPDLAFFGLNDADRAWLTPLAGPIPLRTCEEPLDAPDHPPPGLSRTFVLCRDYPIFAETAARIRQEPGWNYRELAANHLAMVTHPDAVAALLAAVATGAASTSESPAS